VAVFSGVPHRYTLGIFPFRPGHNGATLGCANRRCPKSQSGRCGQNIPYLRKTVSHLVTTVACCPCVRRDTEDAFGKFGSPTVANFVCTINLLRRDQYIFMLGRFVSPCVAFARIVPLEKLSFVYRLLSSCWCFTDAKTIHISSQWVVLRVVVGHSPRKRCALYAALSTFSCRAASGFKQRRPTYKTIANYYQIVCC